MHSEPRNPKSDLNFLKLYRYRVPYPDVQEVDGSATLLSRICMYPHQFTPGHKICVKWVPVVQTRLSIRIRIYFEKLFRIRIQIPHLSQNSEALETLTQMEPLRAVDVYDGDVENTIPRFAPLWKAGSGSGSALKWKERSGSALKWCGSATLVQTWPDQH